MIDLRSVPVLANKFIEYLAVSLVLLGSNITDDGLFWDDLLSAVRDKRIRDDFYDPDNLELQLC